MLAVNHLEIPFGNTRPHIKRRHFLQLVGHDHISKSIILGLFAHNLCDDPIDVGILFGLDTLLW